MSVLGADRQQVLSEEWELHVQILPSVTARGEAETAAQVRADSSVAAQVEAGVPFLQPQDRETFFFSTIEMHVFVFKPERVVSPASEMYWIGFRTCDFHRIPSSREAGFSL